MSLVERVDHFATAFWAALGAGVAGGALYIVRMIFTNQKVIQELQASMAARDEERRLEARMFRETRADVAAIKTYLITHDRQQLRESPDDGDGA